jgi:hypothetical protein
MTHAYAGAEVWLRLSDIVTGDVERLACATEALAHIAFDVRGEPLTPYESEVAPWDAAGFLGAIEAQDEIRAVAYVNGALEATAALRRSRTALTAAALAHYNDFGHSLIYLSHVRRLDRPARRDVEQPLLCAGFARWPTRRAKTCCRISRAMPGTERVAGGRGPRAGCTHRHPRSSKASRFARRSLQPRRGERRAARHPRRTVRAACRQLLRFDEAHALRTGNSVADNVGWLDFSHALTFAHALREQCARLPRHARSCGRAVCCSSRCSSAQQVIPDMATDTDSGIAALERRDEVGVRPARDGADRRSRHRTADLPGPLAEDMDGDAR